MNYTHWIFDLDNTLADSAIDFDALRQELGIPPGKPILEEIDTRPDAEATLLHSRLGELERDFARRATPLPGVHEMLTALAGRGAQLGILTRNSRANALETLAVCDLAKHFEPEHVLGRDEAAQAVVEVGAIEGVRREPAADRAIEHDRIASADAELLDLLAAILTVHLQLQIEHLLGDPLGTRARLGVGEVDRAERLDRAPLQDAPGAEVVRVLAKEQDLVTDQDVREERVRVDPDLAILTDASDLHADLVRVPDQHHREHVIAAWVRVEHEPGVPRELVNTPPLPRDLLEEWTQDPVSHRSFKAHRARRSEDFTHKLELLFGHALCPWLLSRHSEWPLFSPQNLAPEEPGARITNVTNT